MYTTNERIHITRASHSCNKASFTTQLVRKTAFFSLAHVSKYLYSLICNYIRRTVQARMDGIHKRPEVAVLVNERASWFIIVQSGNLERFRSFVERGGNYQSKRSGHSALFLACMEGHTDLAEFITTLPGVNLHEQCMGVDSFYAACQSGSSDLVQFMLSLNVYNINLRQIAGCTAFYVACKMNHLPIVKLLLENGADVDIPDEDGHTPLLSSIGTGKVELFTMLLEHGARPTVEALEFAKLAGRSQMRKILEEKIGTKLPKHSGLVKHCCQCRSTQRSMLTCSRCRNATYCSEECQKMAWPKHKAFCKPPAKIPASTKVEVSEDEVARAAAAEAELLQMLEEEEEASKKKKTTGTTKKK